MASTGHLSVQAIKGRFEQLQTPPYGAPGSAPVAKSPCGRNIHRIPFSRIDPSFHADDDDSADLSSEEEVVTPATTQLCPESRFRSQSFGNDFHCWNQLENAPGRKLVREHSFTGRGNRKNLNGDASAANNKNGSRKQATCNDNLGSFSDKQRLVESIVMNIKNSSTKKKGEEQKSQKAKEILTSKFEKDLKNVLERGVRRKWHSKSQRKGGPFEDNLLSEREKTIIPKQDHVSKPGQQKSHFKLNSIFGVDLYPIRTSGSDNIDSANPSETAVTNNYPLYKSQSSPVMYNKSDNGSRANPRPELPSSPVGNSFEEDFPLNRHEKAPRNRSSGFREGNSRQLTGLGLDSTADSITPSPRLSPVRPPRRRKNKKNKAPQPPSGDRDVASQDENNDAEGKDDFPFCPEGKDDSRDERVTSSNDSGFFSPSQGVALRSPSWESNREFNYEAHCEKSLEELPFAVESESLADSFLRVSHSEEREWGKQSPVEKLGTSLQATSLNDVNVNHPLPAGEPPKKPPRTFAHDIYRSLKPDVPEGRPKSSVTPTHKLTQQEIESLYTKPLKRLKEKPPFPPPSSPRSQNYGPPPSKPAIAPKPVDIINKSKQRFSVVEPLPSVIASSEFSDAKPPVKRNSSFRFSFRKMKKNSPLPLRMGGTKRENAGGRKVGKSNSKTWQPKRTEAEKRVRFPPRVRKEVIYNDVAGDPIYAVPTPDTCSRVKSPQESQSELHYMCSPLFHEEPQSPPSENTDVTHGVDPKEGEKENLPPTPPSPLQEVRDRLRIVDGLKEELRQSCRFVKKRLKGAGHKGVR